MRKPFFLILTMKFLLRIVVLLGVVFCFFLPFRGFGQTIVGSDNAGNYSSWADNDNAGFGFGPWTLNGTGSFEHFLGSSSSQGFGDIDNTGKSFSMWGNPSGGNYANAERYVTDWETGYSFQIDLAIAYRNGNKGIDIYGASSEVIFTFNVANDKYQAEGSDLGWAYDSLSIVHLTVIQYPYHVKIEMNRGTDKYATSISNKVFAGFKVFVGNTDVGSALNNIHFNNLRVRSSPFLLLDDFNRDNNYTVGNPSSGVAGSYIETEDNDPAGAKIGGSQLRLTGGGAAGREMVAFDMSDLYPAAFDASAEDMKWAFNMRSNKNNPSGFNPSYSGSAFILGANKSNFIDPEAFGYAVVLGNTSTTDSIRLIRFEGGLILNSNIKTIAGFVPDFHDSFLSIQVSYESCNKTWTLIARDSTVFTNPSIGSFTLSATAGDSTYTSAELPYTGALWNHGTNTEYLQIDNIYIPNVNATSNLEYIWNGGASGSFGTATNWIPDRDCARNRDRLIFDGGTYEVTDVPNQTIGQLIVRNNASVVLRNQPSDTTSYLYLTGGLGDDFVIEAGSILNFNSKNASYTKEGIRLTLNAGTTGIISGLLQFDNSHNSTVKTHQLLVKDSSAVYVTSGGRIEAIHLHSYIKPFGDSGNSNTIIFEAGSTYVSKSGGNPFGLTQPKSKVVFESGSKFQFDDGYTISITGRIYADFEFVSGNYTQYLGGNSAWKIDNLTIQSGSLNLLGSTNSLPIDIDLKGNLNAAGGTFNYSPVASSKMRFSGSNMQSVFGSGILTLGDSVTVEIDNSAVGTALSIERNIDVHHNFTVLYGVVQSLGAHTLSMLGSNSELHVYLNGSIAGTDVGFGNNLTLLSTGTKTTITGNSPNVKFYNVTVETEDTLVLERGLEVKYGLFDVQTNAKLVINSGGFITSTSPTYAATSQLIYNSANSYGRGLEWTSNAITGNPGYPGNVIIQNGTILFTNNTSSELGIQNDLIIGRTVGGTGTLDMNSDTLPIQVGRDLKLAEGTTISRLTLSNALGGDIKVKGDFVKVADDAIGIFEQNTREVIMNGSAVQNIYGVNNFDYLAIENTSGGVLINNDVLINNRLRLGNGLFNLNGSVLTMEDGSEIMREASTATMSAMPTVVGSESYDLRYTGALTTGVEWLGTDEAIRDLRVEADIILQNNRTYNRDLFLIGADIDLNGNILKARGISSTPFYSGKIDISQPGNRNIYGAAGSRFDITGLGLIGTNSFTKVVVNSSADSLIFGSNVEVRIGNGGVNFGNGNPTLIKGVLSVQGGGYVNYNSCNYAPASVLRFANSFDYQVNSYDDTWAAGAIASGLPGIPYNVEVLGASTDLTLNSPRSLRNDLTITDGKFTLTASSGTFDIGGDWNRMGATSAFVHNDQEVILNGSTPQTINTGNGETFYRLSFDNSGTKSLNEDVTVLEDLNIRGSGALNGNSETITLHGNWNNEVGSSSFMESNSKVVFAGSSIQNVTSPGGETFHDIEMNNSGDGVLMNDPLSISGLATFTNGLIDPNSNEFTIENGGSTNGGNVNSFVNGAVNKIGFIVSSEFEFPVGYYSALDTISVFQPAFITTEVSNDFTGFRAQYFHENYTPGYTNPNNPPPRDGSLTQVSTCSYWIIERVTGTPSEDAIVGLSWGNSDCIDVGDPDELRVARWNGFEWDNQGLLYGSGNTNSGGPAFTNGKVFTTSAFGTFSPFAIGSSGAGLNVLPIQLLSFTASANGEKVETNWLTSTEINNDFFAVERSVDAIHFEEAGRVEGAGNSSSELSYRFTDDSPFAGVSYYRLKQTDFDGKSTFSEIRAVKIDSDKRFELLKVYRSDEGLNMVYRSEVDVLTVEIFDLLGKRLFVDKIQNESGQNTINPSLARGTYILRLNNGVEVISGKFFY